MQFWHDLRELPADVEECIASWAGWTTSGFAHRLFDERSAKVFIGGSLGARHKHAFERCYHPAMQADYFRLCYLFVEGGFYVDADDVCVGTDIGWLFDDGRLKVQPLCYDIAAGTMVSPSVFLHIDAYNPRERLCGSRISRYTFENSASAAQNPRESLLGETDVGGILSGRNYE